MATKAIMLVMVVLTTLSMVSGLSEYQDRLPNGHRIPHPCFTNTIWKGTGHQYHAGGGLLNPFGRDFQANGHKWDNCLCEKDSDGDGVSNGMEMGDPNCMWTMGSTPDNLEGLSHPGVCEPMTDPACKAINNWEVCLEVNFDCPAIESEDVYIEDKVFNKIDIPPHETVYMCMAIEFGDTEDYQAVAMAPIVDNDLIVHHIEMYECVTDSEIDAVREHNGNASACSAMGATCRNMLAAWSLGISGICLVDQAGLRLGMHGAKVAKLIIHYHNPNHLEGQTDASGMRFYMTKTLRPNDIGVFNFGQYYLEIPPGQSYYNQTLTCGPFCTNTFTEPIHFIFGAIHMHYLGTSGYAELYRDGKYVRDIMRQNDYDYLAPLIQNFPDPVEVLPGDTIRYVCEYQSLDRTTVTWWGGGALDEMCNVYFAYYPIQNLTECDNIGSIMKCDYNNKLTTDVDMDYAEKGCDIDDFNKVYNDYMQAELQAVCETIVANCTPACKEALNWAFANHTCLSGEARIGMFRHAPNLRQMQSNCADYPMPALPSESSSTPAGALDCSAVGGSANGAGYVSGGMKMVIGMFATAYAILMF